MSDALANFRELDGVGPAIEGRLHEAGLHTWTALSGILAQLIQVRGVAGDKLRQLAREAADRASEVSNADDDPTGPQRQEAFILRVTLADDGQPTHSTMTHVRSQTDKAWPGWAPKELLAFITDQSGLTAAAPEQQDEEEGTGADDTGHHTTDDSGATTDDAQQDTPPSPARRVHQLVVDVGRTIGGPQDVELVMATPAATDVGAFTYRASLRARAYGSPPTDASWTELAEQTGRRDPPGEAPLRFGEIDLPSGLHRLQVALTLWLQQPRHQPPDLEVTLQDTRRPLSGLATAS